MKFFLFLVKGSLQEINMDNNWMMVMMPRTCNMINGTLGKIHKQLVDLGWIKKYMDMTFIGTSSSDVCLGNILNKERLMSAIEYAMKNSMDHSQDIKFRIVEEVTPMISEAGMGLIIHSTFMKHLAITLGFTPNDAFFMVLAAPAPPKRWGAEEVKIGTRIFEDPEDGKFHCNLNPSQWVMGVFNKSQPEIMHAYVEFEMIIPVIYLKLELGRLGLEKDLEQKALALAKAKMAGDTLEIKEEVEGSASL
jgi:hypothetical protein